MHPWIIPYSLFPIILLQHASLLTETVFVSRFCLPRQKWPPYVSPARWRSPWSSPLTWGLTESASGPPLLFLFFLGRQRGYANFSSAKDSRTTITGKSYNSHQIEVYVSMVMVYVCVYMVSDEDALVVVELANGITNNTYSDYSPVTAIVF